ncbi:hypothetical protein F4804DRAFT_352972 [Jackrogersella minutella]|nr:hypothetical protein F4804DRAFT_352972 [Jackrogersella minutella]
MPKSPQKRPRGNQENGKNNKRTDKSRINETQVLWNTNYYPADAYYGSKANGSKHSSSHRKRGERDKSEDMYMMRKNRKEPATIVYDPNRQALPAASSSYRGSRSVHSRPISPAPSARLDQPAQVDQEYPPAQAEEWHPPAQAEGWHPPGEQQYGGQQFQGNQPGQVPAGQAAQYMDARQFPFQVQYATGYTANDFAERNNPAHGHGRATAMPPPHQTYHQPYQAQPDPAAYQPQPAPATYQPQPAPATYQPPPPAPTPPRAPTVRTNASSVTSFDGTDVSSVGYENTQAGSSAGARVFGYQYQWGAPGRHGERVLHRDERYRRRH